MHLSLFFSLPPITTSSRARVAPVRCVVEGKPQLLPLREFAPTTTMAAPPPLQSPENRVGHSVFYDCLASPVKPTETDDELSDIDQECTIFSGVTYLGATRINAPKSEKEILQKVAEMNASSPLGMKVSVSIPTRSEGLVV